MVGAKAATNEASVRGIIVMVAFGPSGIGRRPVTFVKGSEIFFNDVMAEACA